MPAARVFYLLAAASVLAVAGVLVPALGWLALALDLLLAAAFVYDLRRARRLSLSAARRWPELLSQGAPAELVVEVEGDPEAELEILLREVLHPALAPVSLRQGMTIPPGRRALWRYQLVPRRRGEHLTGPLVARVRGPWGLAWRQLELLPAERRRVFPQVRWDGKVGHLVMLAHRRLLGQHPQRLQGAGTELYALREYLRGDPPGKIHWKASARHGRLISREETWEHGARLVILLDAGRTMSGRDGARSKLDHALAAALALVRVAAARGDTVSLVAFSDKLERTVRVHGSHQVEKAYAALYDLEAQLVEPAFDLAAARAAELESRRSTVVLFTSVVDLAAADLLRQAVLRLERRHRPILINLEDPELIGLAHGAPKNVAQAFAKVSALEIQLANRRLAIELRHAGVRVVNAAADRLALETLEAYLAQFGVRG
jgi:uncharacterized protein (DUF58 family)